ncbi:MAG: glutathione S-transferase N-terminal domain-containing protein [Arenicellales bacterium]
MIDVYYWTTPNGHKVTILLEELGIEYKVVPVDIGKGQQFETEFLEISPNNRIPAIVDHQPFGADRPISVFESGAILLYLAEKYAQFIPADPTARVKVLEWLFWQMGGFGPMLGQNHHFGFYAKDKIPYAIERYVKETSRLYGVLNRQLKSREYICDEYSIADMACYPWTVSHARQQQDLNDFPEVKRWHAQMKSRPAVERAYEIPGKMNLQGGISDEAAKILFGQDSSVVR